MVFYFLHPAAGTGPRVPSDEQKLVTLHEAPHNTNEGSEFLDDAIRLDEQPVVYAEDSIAPGSPESML